MVTLAEFYTKVSAERCRGTSLDSVIPMKVGQAVKWMGLSTLSFTWRSLGQFLFPLERGILAFQLGLRVCSLENHKGRWKLSLPS